MRTHLNQGRIVTHPFIIAELALGSLEERTRTLALLDLLPQVRVAQLGEVRLMIEARRLYSLDPRLYLLPRVGRDVVRRAGSPCARLGGDDGRARGVRAPAARRGPARLVDASVDER